MHHLFHRIVAGVLLAAGLAGTAHARNDKLLLPIEQAMRTNGTRALVSDDVPLRFGKMSANGAELMGGTSVHGVADPYGQIVNGYTNQRRQLPDEVVCLNAFRKALVELQTKARAAGADAVVGIVSNYNGVEMDSPSAYECHIGHTRGVVDLRGQFARGGVPPRSAMVNAPAMTQPLPGGDTTAMAPGAAQPAHIASGFAAIDDLDAIPYLSERGRKDYAEFLKRGMPRAFAIASNGAYWYSNGLKPADASQPSDPIERALTNCERTAKQPCKLYAVNGAVVWRKEP